MHFDLEDKLHVIFGNLIELAKSGEDPDGLIAEFASYLDEDGKIKTPETDPALYAKLAKGHHGTHD